MRRIAVVGIIPDTHGLLRPEALRALDGSDLIVHAGDVGAPEILDALRSLAPVVAVRGNVDKAANGLQAGVLNNAGRTAGTAALKATLWGRPAEPSR